MPSNDTYHAFEDEEFLEGWIRFASFHRTRNVLAALDAYERSTDIGYQASQVLLAVTEYAQAYEDFGTWSVALRSHVAEKSLIHEALDSKRFNWLSFFSGLSGLDAEGFANLFALPSPQECREIVRAEYVSTLNQWLARAQAIAERASVSTGGTQKMLYRVLNKTKHGLAVALVRDAGRVTLLFPPIGNEAEREAIAQPVTRESIESYLRETYAVNELTTSVLRSWFLLRFGREPESPWPALRPEQADISVDTIRQAVVAGDPPAAHNAGDA